MTSLLSAALVCAVACYCFFIGNDMYSLLSASLFCALGFFCARSQSVVASGEHVGESTRVHNFSAGPGMMSNAVMKKAQSEFTNYNGHGMSFMEMSHRDAGGPVQVEMERVVAMYRELLDIPANYKVLFMHGGAHAQFSAVPLNLLRGGDTADYVVTGYWSKRAMTEGSRHIPKPREIVAAKDGAIVPPSEWDLNPEAAYVHLCGSETIDGLEFLEDPEIPNGVPLVGDFTSTLLSRPINVSRYGAIYASGGKNLGPAGFTLVIVREDLIAEGLASDSVPPILSYRGHASTSPISSIYNTPPTFQIYMAGLVLDDVKERGGIAGMRHRAIRVSSMVYNEIDNSNGFYRNVISPEFRSRMNVPFRIGTDRRDMEELFAREAAEQGMFQTFGHPVRGGLRITVYNGLPDAAVDAIVVFMKKFAEEHRAEVQ